VSFEQRLLSDNLTSTEYHQTTENGIFQRQVANKGGSTFLSWGDKVVTYNIGRKNRCTVTDLKRNLLTLDESGENGTATLQVQYTADIVGLMNDQANNGAVYLLNTSANLDPDFDPVTMLYTQAFAQDTMQADMMIACAPAIVDRVLHQETGLQRETDPYHINYAFASKGKRRSVLLEEV
jgi:hypothetical protein